jgi:rfaE bifunctional protein kinase chain/domain
MNPAEVIKSFSGLRALIIGDVMLDRYFIGSVDRISPEAPVPVVNVAKKELRLGGAANVALNIKELGATPILVSVVGKDEAGKELISLLKKNKIDSSSIVLSEDRPTTVKTRVLSHNQQMLRFDEEAISDVTDAESGKVMSLLKDIVKKNKIDVVIYEDYNKGFLTKTLIEDSLKLFAQQNIPTTVDPKKKNFLEYKGVSLFKPNLREVKEALNVQVTSDINDLNNSAKLLKSKLKNAVAMITLADKGVYFYDGKKGTIIPAHVRNIADVSGAGDTVIATAALGLAAKLPLLQTMEIANLAGGLVCEEVGVVPINKERLIQELKEQAKLAKG